MYREKSLVNSASSPLSVMQLEISVDRTILFQTINSIYLYKHNQVSNMRGKQWNIKRHSCFCSRITTLTSIPSQHLLLAVKITYMTKKQHHPQVLADTNGPHKRVTSQLVIIVLCTKLDAECDRQAMVVSQLLTTLGDN